MTVDIPEYADTCWPVNTAVCPSFDTWPPEVQAQSISMAGAAMRMLTGFRVGGCPVTIRPCRKGCGGGQTWAEFPVSGPGTWPGGWGSSITNPTVINGNWWNITCGCGVDNCSCTTVCEVVLPGYAADVTVLLDGVEVDDTAYRVDDGNRLVRTDGDCWPLCQDMNADVDQLGTFAVTYTPGIAVDGWGAYAAGVLACEFASAIGGDSCRLPPNVTQIVRLGVTITIGQQTFPGGMTGIREVDEYVSYWNPNRLTSPSVVYSPDVKYGRTTTWQAP